MYNDPDEVAFVCMTDATWAVWRDGSSQGGYLMLAAHKDVLNSKTVEFVQYVVVDWRSWRLPRVSRSSGWTRWSM
eukprot:3772973-Pyramimonas_sp.AAC.1